MWRFDRRVDDELAPEPRSQRARAPLPYLRDVRRHAEALERSDLVLETARQDTLECREIGRDVQREAVRRDAARYPHTDRGDLRWPTVRKIDPDTGLSPLAPRRHAIASKRIAQCFLDRADIGDEIRAFGERRDGVTDKLAGTVVCDVAAAVDAIDRCAVGAQNVVTDKKMVRRSAPSDRVDGIVLEEQETVRTAVAHPCRDRFLHPPCVDVRNASQPGRAQGLTQG